MSDFQLLVVAGTHGNEINAPWLMDKWAVHPELLNTNGLRVAGVIGNPQALKVSSRYIDRDLNRSFCSVLLDDPSAQDHEVLRARELLDLYGPKGLNPCQIAIDLHSTTSCMGSSIVVYGRRPADLALVALIQARLGIPIYLHEGDETQQGFLVESWPCGFVIEIGPVPQGLLQANIVEKSRLVLEASFDEISKIKSGIARFPKQLIVYRHLGSLDFPRDVKGHVQACLHPEIQGKDWQPITQGTPLFLKPDGEIIPFDGNNFPVPVFINEAAYVEKQIAMSLTEKETIAIESEYKRDLKELVR